MKPQRDRHVEHADLYNRYKKDAPRTKSNISSRISKFIDSNADCQRLQRSGLPALHIPGLCVRERKPVIPADSQQHRSIYKIQANQSHFFVLSPEVTKEGL